jgi:hypothetical protein
MITDVRTISRVAVLLAIVCGTAACERAPVEGARNSAEPPKVEAAADPALFAPYIERYRELMLRDQSAEGASFIELLRATDAELTALSERFGAKIERVDGSIVHVIDFDALTATGTWQGERKLAEEVAAVRAALAAMNEAGAWDRWSAMVRAPRYEREIEVGPLVSMPMPQLPAVRRAARVFRAAAREAATAGDYATAVARVEDTLALARQAAREPIMLARLVANAVEAVAFAEARLIASRPEADERTLASLARALDEHRLSPIDWVAEGELLLFESAAADVYTNGPAGIARLMGVQGKPSQALPAAGLGDGMPGRAADEAAARAIYGSFGQASRVPRSKRSTDAPEAYRNAAASESLLLGLLWPGMDRGLLTLDQAAADRAGTHVIVALERQRRSSGSYPEELADLVPARLAAVPSDPYTGGPLGYLPPSRGPFGGGRAYVVYAAGPDGVDDGGKVNFANRFMLWQEGKPIQGVDWLINGD